MTSALVLPDLDTLHPVINGGHLPVNPRDRIRCLGVPSFSIPDAAFFRMKAALLRLDTDFLESEDGRIYVLSYVNRGCGLSPVVSSMAEKVRGRKKAAAPIKSAS
jgi:hypothetical protein